MTRDSLTAIPTAESLPEEEQNRLAQILDAYLVALENGVPISPAELLERHPADADYLRLYLSGLQLFHAAANPNRSGARYAREDNSAPGPAVRSIGEFEIVREIGRGGMGVVYEAVQTSLRRRVALKVLPYSATNDPRQIGRFKNEAQAAAQVQHPNIVPVFAVGEVDGVHYFAMQLIEGESLATLLGYARPASVHPGDATTVRNATPTRIDHPPCPRNVATPGSEAVSSRIVLERSDSDAWVPTLARYGLQAAEALHAAHEYGVVHRDVKPSNLLIDRQDKLWVADFGLARFREGADLTRTGDICGTMRYMSPEQALGQASLVDHRTDVYSLGVTMYELAVLRHPVGDVHDLRRFFGRGGVECKPLRFWNRRIPVDFDTIVMKAIAEDRESRYATAQDMADDLRRFLAGEPILATCPTRFTRLRKWAARHKRSVAVGACLLVLGLVGGLSSFSYVAGARSQVEHAMNEAFASSQEAGRLLYDVPLRTAEQLAAIPGAEGVRRELLEQSLKYYTRLRAQAFGDPALGADLALAYSKIGGLTAMMGDRQRALQSHENAKRILVGLLAEQPDNAEYARSLALCCNNAGLVLAGLGRGDEALTEFDAARRLQQRWHARLPENRALATELAATLGNLGVFYRDRDQATEAAKWFDAAIAAQEELLPASAADESLLRGLAAAYNNLGSLQEASDTVAATRQFERAIALQAALVRDHRWNQLDQAELARTYNNLGFVCALRHDWPRAQRSYSDAIELQRRFVDISPLAVEFRRDLAITYNNLGMAFSEIGRLDEGAQAFEKALSEQRPLLATLPDNAAILSDMGGVYNNLGMLHQRRERPADAEGAFLQAIDYQQQALDADPGNATARDLLSRHYVNYARNLRQQGKLAAATEISLKRQRLLAGAAEPTADQLN